MEQHDLDTVFSHKSDEWSTDIDFYNRLDSEFHFTLDPASDGINQKCSKYFTPNEDGLKQSWADNVVFCNPPYSNVYGWLEKAFHEAKLNNVTSVFLLPSRTDNASMHDFILNKEYISDIRFIRGRLKFGGSKNSAPFPSMVVVVKPPVLGRQFINISSMKNKINSHSRKKKV